MSLNLNRVMIAGNLTRDPQLKFLANEKAVANFGLAINRKWKTDSGEAKEETTFVDVEAWGRTAELAGQYLTKGRGAMIEGRIKMEQWTDKESGQKRSKLVIAADAIHFTDNMPRSDASAARSGDANAQADLPPRGVPRTPPSGSGDDEPPFTRSEQEYQP